MKLFAIILFSLYAVAVTAAPENSTVTVFTEEDTKAIDVPYESVYHNNLKWNVGMLGRGTFFMEYERELTKYLTIEPGLGVTYRDIVGLFADDMSDDGYSSEDYTYTPKYGPAFSLRTRVYPSQVVDMEGFYVSLAAQARWYNKELALDRETYSVGTNMSDFHFAVGWQQEGYIFDDMTVDFYFGVAVRNITHHTYDYDSDEVVTSRINRPAIIMGFKYGYPF